MPVNNPALVDLIADQWNPAIINALRGVINILEPFANLLYYQTYRRTGEAAPAVAPGDPDFEGMEIYNRRDRVASREVFVGGGQFQASSGIDVYIYPVNGTGKIRVDQFE